MNLTLQKSPKQDSRGFALWIVIVGLVVLLFLGAVGWAIAKKSSNKAGTSAQAGTSAGSKATTTQNKTDLNSTISPPSKSYTVGLPTGWFARTCSGNLRKDFLMLAPTKSLLGNCASPPYGIIFINKYAGNISQTEDVYNADPYYQNLVYNQVYIGSFTGYNIEYIVGTRTGDQPASGTAEALYNLYEPNKNQTYLFSYSQSTTTPSSKDAFNSIAQSITIPETSSSQKTSNI